MSRRLAFPCLSLTALLMTGCGDQLRFTPSADAPAGLAAVAEAQVKVVSSKPEKGVEIGRAVAELNWMFSDTARSNVIQELGNHGATFAVLTESKRTNMGGTDVITVEGIGYVLKP